MLDTTPITEYTLEEPSTFLFDLEELDEDREYLLPIYSKGVMGYSKVCPRCEGVNTFFSMWEEDWVCLDCRLIFSWELSEVFNMLRENDKEEEQWLINSFC